MKMDCFQQILMFLINRINTNLNPNIRLFLIEDKTIPASLEMISNFKNRSIHLLPLP